MSDPSSPNRKLVIMLSGESLQEDDVDAPLLVVVVVVVVLLLLLVGFTPAG